MENYQPYRFLVAPDSFKGTMSALEVCQIMREKLGQHFPGSSVTTIPMADGGEGTVESFLTAMGGELIRLRVKGPYFEDLESSYGLLPDGTAVVEMAAAAGLPLVGENRHAELTTTFGVGQLIADALERGARNIVVGLGGSATNDGGCGMAAALGVRFLNEDGEAFVPVGESLQNIATIDMAERNIHVGAAKIVAMCDINNPLCGLTGAAAMFGPQKGATPDQVLMLDAGLEHMARVVKRDLGVDVLNLEGAAAAGGMGAGIVAYLGASLHSGIETVLETTGFDDLLKASDLVFSGEGKFDVQSLHGKVVVGVAERCKKAGKPLIAVAGMVDDAVVGAAEEAGVSHVCSINRTGVPLDIAIKHPHENLASTMDLLCTLLKEKKRESALPARIHL